MLGDYESGSEHGGALGPVNHGIISNYCQQKKTSSSTEYSVVQ